MSSNVGFDVPEPAEGKLLPRWITPDGWTILRIPWEAVPGYDFEGVCRGMSEEGIRREVLIDWTATVGKRVYPEFGAGVHVSKRPLAYDPSRPLYCGWDFGSTPAFVVSQLAKTGQWYLFDAVVPPPEESWGCYAFGKHVAEYLTAKYCVPHGIELAELDLIHFGDPAGQARPPRTLDTPKEDRACFDILRDGLTLDVVENGKTRKKKLPGWGWHINPGAVNITDRLEGVKARLSTLGPNGEPLLLVNLTATYLIEAFAGGYHYKELANGTGYAPEPEKNWYSHGMDAMGYIATKLFFTSRRGESDEDQEARRRKFRSHAANRRTR